MRMVVELADKNPAGLLSVAILFMALALVLGVLGYLVKPIARSLVKYLPGRKAEMPDPFQVRWLGLAESQTAVIKDLSTNQTRGIENETRLIERQDQIEAILARQAGSSEEVKQLLAGLTEASRTLSVAVEGLITRAAQSETADQAQVGRQGVIQLVNAHTDSALAPVLEHGTVQTAALGALDTKIDALPPRLDALHVKMDGIPAIVKQAFDAIAAERDAATAKVTTLLGEVSARDATIAQQAQQIANQTAEIERLRALNIAAAPSVLNPPPAPLSLDTSVPPSTATPDAPPEGVPA
jgi:hypothetical protein